MQGFVAIHPSFPTPLRASNCNFTNLNNNDPIVNKLSNFLYTKAFLEVEKDLALQLSPNQLGLVSFELTEEGWTMKVMKKNILLHLLLSQVQIGQAAFQQWD